jgi:RAD54-like protein 2
MPINTLQNWLAEFNMWLPAPDGVSCGVSSSSNTVGSNNSSSSSSDNIAGTQQPSIPTDQASDNAVDANSTPEIRPRNFALYVLNDSHKTMAARSKVSMFLIQVVTHCYAEVICSLVLFLLQPLYCFTF